MAITLDEHQKEYLKRDQRLTRKRFEKTLAEIEREILIEKDFRDLELHEDWSVDDLEEFYADDSDLLERLRYIRHKIRRLVVPTHFNLQQEYNQWVLRTYKQVFLADGIWPTKWILNSVTIMRNLELKKNRWFFPLMNYLCESRLDPTRSRKVANHIGVGGYNVDGKVRDYVILQRPNRKKIADKVGMSQTVLKRYLKELVHWGILKDLGKYGSNQPKVYAIGYYQSFNLGVKPIWFLKESPEMKKALREFDI